METYAVTNSCECFLNCFPSVNYADHNKLCEAAAEAARRDASDVWQAADLWPLASWTMAVAVNASPCCIALIN